jgi:hypothetical protein
MEYEVTADLSKSIFAKIDWDACDGMSQAEKNASIVEQASELENVWLTYDENGNVTVHQSFGPGEPVNEIDDIVALLLTSFCVCLVIGVAVWGYCLYRF